MLGFVRQSPLSAGIVGIRELWGLNPGPKTRASFATFLSLSAPACGLALAFVPSSGWRNGRLSGPWQSGVTSFKETTTVSEPSPLAFNPRQPLYKPALHIFDGFTKPPLPVRHLCKNVLPTNQSRPTSRPPVKAIAEVSLQRNVLGLLDWSQLGRGRIHPSPGSLQRRPLQDAQRDGDIQAIAAIIRNAVAVSCLRGLRILSVTTTSVSI